VEGIRNIFCVGRNYVLHAAELGNEVPDSPMIFMKPTHAVAEMNGGRIGLPGQYGDIHYEAELVVRIGRPYAPGLAASNLIDGFALGLDLTMRELQGELKKKQHPWLKAKGFRNSALLTAFRPLTDPLAELEAREFVLRINSVEKQRGHIRDMIFDLQQLIDHIGNHYGLDAGDLIFTGTPAGVGSVQDGDHLALYWGEECLGECRIKLD